MLRFKMLVFGIESGGSSLLLHFLPLLGEGLYVGNVTGALTVGELVATSVFAGRTVENGVDLPVVEPACSNSNLRHAQPELL